MSHEKEQYLEQDAFSSGAPTPLKSTSLAEEDFDAVPFEELSPAEQKAERRFVSLTAKGLADMRSGCTCSRNM